MKRLEYVKALRELADYVESRPLPDEWRSYVWMVSSYPVPELHFTVLNKEGFGEIVAALGSFKKESTEYNLRAVVTLPSGAQVRVAIAHEQVCEKVVVGKKVVPFRQAYMVDAVPEHEEEIVEWKCPESFIALKGDTHDEAE